MNGICELDLSFAYTSIPRTPLGTTLYRSLTQTNVLSPLESVPRNGFYRGRLLSFPHSGPLLTAAREELLSTDNSTNWVIGWRPFHTHLVVFSSQADFQPTADN
jgi:hypothetical protein